MANPKHDGGPAFPVEHALGIEPGLSIRDYFAGQALAALLSVDDGEPCHHEAVEDYAKRIASGAYLYADAMLAAREKSNG